MMLEQSKNGSRGTLFGINASLSDALIFKNFLIFWGMVIWPLDDKIPVSIGCLVMWAFSLLFCKNNRW